MEDSHKSGPKMNVQEVFNPQVIKKGIIVFVSISLAALIGIFLYTNTGETVEAWSKIKVSYLLIGLIFIFNDLYIGGLRNHIFIREFVPGISQWVSVKANLANIFMGAVTPSQSGGGPAQWYILYRNGVSIPDNISNSFFNWISTLIFFPLTGAMSIYILRDKVPSGFVMHLTNFGFSVFTSLLIVVLIGLFSPQLLGKVLKVIGLGIKALHNKSGDRVIKIGANVEEQMKDYRKRYVGLIKTKPQLMIFSFLLTILLYFNKYALAYIFVLAFGLEVDFWAIIAVMAVLYLLLYFAPSPGGSGIAEVSLVALITPFVSEDYSGSITLLHRSFLIFIPALIGAWVVLRQVAKEG